MRDFKIREMRFCNIIRILILSFQIGIYSIFIYFLYGFNILIDNIIRENQWGGVDIRYGGDLVVIQNIICNGMFDGIVIGEKGRGSIENNIIIGWFICI